jgi:hypothetical protein
MKLHTIRNFTVEFRQAMSPLVVHGVWYATT